MQSSDLSAWRITDKGNEVMKSSAYYTKLLWHIDDTFPSASLLIDFYQAHHQAIENTKIDIECQEISNV